MKRVGIATAAAAVAALALALVLGLLGGTPTGAGDNGDGYRLFCGPGLTPATPNHKASWLGGVVLDFGRVAPCPDPQPSSAAVLFGSVANGHGAFSLLELGWLYVLLVFLVTLLAAWAVQARGPRGLLFLVPPLVPLLEPSFARLFLSTFAEPAGLFGAYTLLCGLAVIAATKAGDGFARLAALVLVAVGGVVGGLAKIGFLPLFVLAVLVCAVTAARPGSGRRWSGRIVGPALAVLLVLEIITPVRANLAWQERNYADVNAVNLVYTLALAEVPGSATRLGLPEAAQGSAGYAYYPRGPESLAGSDVVLADPAAMKHRAWELLLEHPGALVGAIGTGLQATLGRSVPYLPDEPWTTETRPLDRSTPVSGDMGGDPVTFRAWLDGMAVPWWPALLVLLGLAGAVVALARRRRSTTRYGFVAGVAVTGALGIAAMAVVGDGYFEIAKHVWLAAYLLDVAALSLCVVVAPVALRRGRELWNRRRGSEVVAAEEPRAAEPIN
ncbi:hypothetical protein Q5425_34815 [Amycolatopsis sp. A133]|uniref:glycan biosynthesis hexose transferase WsfD n=1 Tax=Amycolatopsis sp. A133 TaxID=3064472 RepID=UPI0027F3EC6A|nr:hypothetical protein [Amycolatopsis sp. A133]MDQ7808938.1 hypothetical protein [Amycolatopsis sp. A133]